MQVQVGQIWRSNLGGHALYVTAVEDRIAHVQRADASKKTLARGQGQIVAISEMEEWTMLKDVAATQEP